MNRQPTNDQTTDDLTDAVIPQDPRELDDDDRVRVYFGIELEENELNR